ncbi:MAG: hypothetical protein V3V08_11440 [Nannocystaceae bacterium]
MSGTDERSARMSAYLDARLDPSDKEAFERDLQGSVEASKEVVDLQRMISVMGDLPAVEVPPDFYKGVLRKLRKPQHSRGAAVAGLVSLPFQLVSVVIIVLVGALYVLAELERETHYVAPDIDGLRGGAGSVDTDVPEIAPNPSGR